MNGLIAGQRLKQILPRVKLIYLTMNQDPDVAAEAFRLGASGYLVKSSAASELVHAIKEVLLALRHRYFDAVPKWHRGGHQTKRERI